MLTLEQSIGPVKDGYTFLDSPLYSYAPLPVCQEKHRLPLEVRKTEALHCYTSVEGFGNYHHLVVPVLFFTTPMCCLFCDMHATEAQCILPLSYFSYFFFSSSCISMALTTLTLGTGQPQHSDAF